MRQRYFLVAWHGEARSVWHVVDDEARQQPSVVRSFTDRAAAERHVEALNAADASSRRAVEQAQR